MTIQYPRTLKNNIHHSNKWGSSPFFHLDTNPVLGHLLVYSVDKTHVLVVTVELTWFLLLSILSFNFVWTWNKSLRFTRFRRSYANHPVVVLSNQCQIYTAFLLDVRCSKWPCSFFWSCLSPMIILLWSTPMVNFVNFKMSLETTRCGIVIHKYIKNNRTLHLCT